MDSEMLGESTLGSQGRDSMMDEDWAATEFDPQDEHANLGGNPADEDEQYDEDDVEFARDGDSSAALSAGRGLRGLSLGTEDAAGRKSLSAAADVTLPDDFGDDVGDEMPADYGDLEPMEPFEEDDMGGVDGVARDDSLALDESRGEEHDEAPQHEEEEEPAAATARPRKNRKRRLLIDEVTELTSAEIKANLADTSDIVAIMLPPRQRPRIAAKAEGPSLDERMHMPNIKGLAPELMAMFRMTMRGAEPLPFRFKPGYNENGKIAGGEADGGATATTTGRKRSREDGDEPVETGRAADGEEEMGLEDDDFPQPQDQSGHVVNYGKFRIFLRKR